MRRAVETPASERIPERRGDFERERPLRGLVDGPVEEGVGDLRRGGDVAGERHETLAQFGEDPPDIGDRRARLKGIQKGVVARIGIARRRIRRPALGSDQRPHAVGFFDIDLDDPREVRRKR